MIGARLGLENTHVHYPMFLTFFCDFTLVSLQGFHGNWFHQKTNFIWHVKEVDHLVAILLTFGGTQLPKEGVRVMAQHVQNKNHLKFHANCQLNCTCVFFHTRKLNFFVGVDYLMLCILSNSFCGTQLPKQEWWQNMCCREKQKPPQITRKLPA